MAKRDNDPTEHVHETRHHPAKKETPAYTRRYLDNPEAPRRRASDAMIVAPVVPLEYPKMQYHATEPPKTVSSKEEDDALGPEWFDEPQEQAKVYPSWRYHLDKPPVLVQSATEDAALGEGWHTSVSAAATSGKQA